MSRNRLILAIDQGTTNTKALLMARGGEVVARASRRVPISFPRPGWVEQDPRELLRSVVEAAQDCLNQTPGADILALGISNQRESVVAWDRATGEPAGPCIVWQCRRTAARCQELAEKHLGPMIQERSGLAIDPLFSSSKAAWLLENAESQGDLLVGTVDSWLLWSLTRGSVHATDVSNASRTQLMNLHRAEWDADLMSLFGIPPQCLPQICPSSGVFGTIAEGTGLPAGLPVAAMIGDSHAALFGHAAFNAGTVKATYGTGSSLMSPTNGLVVSSHGLSSTVAWACGGAVQYALEGNITNTGGTVDWIAGLLGFHGPNEVAKLAATVPDSGGVYLVPAFAGLGAPHWDPEARGLVCGLTRGSTRAHVARAALDSIAFQINDVLEALRKDSGLPLPELLVDGGASSNDTLMQFQSDIAGCSVVRSGSSDLSLRGAAWLAGLAVGFWESPEELRAIAGRGDRFEPTMPESRRRELLDGWRRAVSRTVSGRLQSGMQTVSGQRVA